MSHWWSRYRGYLTCHTGGLDTGDRESPLYRPRPAILYRMTNVHHKKCSYCPSSSRGDSCLSKQDTAVLRIHRPHLTRVRGPLVLIQTDVAGSCETSYYHVPTEGSSSVTVRKSKNLKTCSHRTDRFISLPSTSYSAPIRSLPLIK
uniref:Uncharacterized protein n=1 Tax=Timema poppense TaxID=170557 RepID=A0A7R9DXR9_TIMPO|nr:unnamed protein product [Timema poppensis]